MGLWTEIINAPVKAIFRRRSKTAQSVRIPAATTSWNRDGLFDAGSQVEGYDFVWSTRRQIIDLKKLQPALEQLVREREIQASKDMERGMLRS